MLIDTFNKIKTKKLKFYNERYKTYYSHFFINIRKFKNY
jgi:hypothetical protein